MFLQVCVCPQGGCLVRGGGACSPPRETATAADGTHPTGMHSCTFNISQESPADEFFSPDMSGWDMSDASTALDRLHMSDQQRKQLEIATNLEMIHQRVRQVGEFLKHLYLEHNCKFKPEFSCENG